MVFPTSHWMDQALDLGVEWAARVEWERLGAVYKVSVYIGDEHHTGEAKTLDGAAWALMQKVRPAPQDAGPQAG